MHGPLRVDARIEERPLQGAQRVLEAGAPQAQIRSGGGGAESRDAQLRRAESRNLLAPGLRVVKSVVPFAQTRLDSRWSRNPGE